jgi:hypothetical protein
LSDRDQRGDAEDRDRFEKVFHRFLRHGVRSSHYHTVLYPVFHRMIADLSEMPACVSTRSLWRRLRHEIDLSSESCIILGYEKFDVRLGEVDER